MVKEYRLEGMTCGNCESQVRQKIEAIPNVLHAHPDRIGQTVKVESDGSVTLSDLESVLPNKYTISHKIGDTIQGDTPKSKLQQLRPLFLVLGGILLASILLNVRDWEWMSFMADFMGLFLVTFSFFKFLDYKGFPDSFAMYDPIAKVSKAYAWIYPFIEMALGIAFLTRFQLKWIIGITLFILGVTTFGVIQSLTNKRKIQCACLGTALKLPMTEATLIENILMISMGIIGLFLL